MALTDKQIQELAERLVTAIEQLAPSGPSFWTIISSLAPVAALLAAGLVAWIGWQNLEHQRKALAASVANDDRSEWWKRAQWALEASMSVENARLATMGNEMLRLLSTSPMASDADKDLLDSGWKVGTDVVTQESAEDAIAEATAFSYEADMDDDSETSENEETKEDVHG